MSGVYCLVLALDEEHEISVHGRKKNFPEGFYCYVDYVKNNLKKRLKHHLSQNKKKFMNIDYLLERGRLINFKTIKTWKNIECKISKKIEKISSKTVDFGPMKCKCKSHLHYFRECPLYLKEFHAIFEELKI